MPHGIKTTIYCKVFFGVVLLLLSGCATKEQPQPQKTLEPIPCLKTAEVRQQLEKLPIIVVGQTVTIVLPSDQIFKKNSANLSDDAKQPLKAVACLVAARHRVTIQVKGYSNVYSTAAYNRALSQSQAAKIADYLRNHGVDYRLIYAEGLGNIQPLASDQTPNGQALNRRIEIKFWEIN